MSLRKSPELTPQLLSTARQNSQHSTGPRSAATKQNSKLNAVKHGAYVSDENQQQSRLREMATGEDLERFQTLRQELASAIDSGDALQEKQIEDLAWLYCRRERLERAQEALRRRDRQHLEDWQHRRRQEIARVTFGSSRHELIELDMSGTTDELASLKKTLSFLELIREEVKQRTFRPRQYGVLETFYKGLIGWRMALILRLLRLFSDPNHLAEVQEQQEDEEYREGQRKRGMACEPATESDRQELLRLLDEEIASFPEEFQYAEKAYEDSVLIDRDACLAPEGETWSMMLRQEATLDRAIDRKVRILLKLREECNNVPIPVPGQADGGGMRQIDKLTPENDIQPETRQDMGDREIIKKTERSGNVYENKGGLWKKRERTGNVYENKGSYPFKAGMLLKRKAVDEWLDPTSVLSKFQM